MGLLESNFDEFNNVYAKHTMEEIQEWLDSVQDTAHVKLERIKLEDCFPWEYDESLGEIRNPAGSFFRIAGVRASVNGDVIGEQPIILQNEIGFLGIISCKINGVWHYLMQAKIEPGNVNVVQVSPTIQATKSNFECKHGGTKPKYLDYFLNMKPSDILVDQIQSEQSSRFLAKRNRNVILMVDHELEENSTHRWLTLKQIKELMHYDNLINMDTRTVLSCIPYVLLGQDADVPFHKHSYFMNSAENLDRKTIVKLYNVMNNYKMFNKHDVQKVPITELAEWEMRSDEIVCKHDFPFKVVYCDVSIVGREVTNWKQPLIASNGVATLGLICADFDGMLKFLVKPRNEIGCMDGIEIGPTVQIEPFSEEQNDIDKYFFKKLKNGEGVLTDIMLSEEGGRFYQEQNRNVIIKVDAGELDRLPEGYVWSDYGTLNIMTQINNCLSIQLRNLLSLLEI